MPTTRLRGDGVVGVAQAFRFFATGASEEAARAMWLSGGRPTQARKMFSMQPRCLKRALTTGAPGGTSGALMRYERMDMIGWKEEKALMACVLYWMREVISARMTRSRMSGVASSESSHVLCITMVLVPPMKISEVYSSIARFESATYGTYLMTTTWSGCSRS